MMLFYSPPPYTHTVDVYPISLQCGIECMFFPSCHYSFLVLSEHFWKCLVLLYHIMIHNYSSIRRCPCGVMVKAMVCKIVAHEFVLQSRYYIHFQTNTLGKGMNPHYPPSYGLNSTTTVLLGEWLWH